MNKIAQYLNQYIAGNVFDKMSVRNAYATDRSILKTVPRLVALPETTNDLCKLIRFSNQLSHRGYRLPITIRGKGNDKTGAAIGSGLVISTERLNAIQEIDPRGRLVRVQAGVTLGELNAALALHGLTIPIADHETETIGGLIATCPTDNFSGRYGGIYNFVDRAEIILSDGTITQTDSVSLHSIRKSQKSSDLEPTIYKTLDQLIDENQTTIDDLTKTGVLDSSGYSAISLVRNRSTLNLLPLLFSSQGTLAVVSEVILRCELLPPTPKYLLAGFNSARSALNFLEFTNALNPLELNLYDGRIFKTAIDHGKKLNLPAQKLDKGYFVLVGFDAKPRTSRRLIKKCLEQLPTTAFSLVENDDSYDTFACIRSSLISYLNNDVRGERAPLADDTFIPAENLQGFLEGLKTLEAIAHTSLPVYGSFATSNYSVRPAIELDTIAGRQFALKFLSDYANLVYEHHGSITGGAPEGAVKPLSVDYVPDQRLLYEKIKQTFDPNNILNPDIKTGARSRNTLRHLRTFYKDYIVD